MARSNAMNGANGSINLSLRLELLGRWIESEWEPAHPDRSLVTVRISEVCLDTSILQKFDTSIELSGGYRFLETRPHDCPVAVRIGQYTHKGRLTVRTGGYVYRFGTGDSPDEAVEVLVVSSYFTDTNGVVSLASVPEDFLPVWADFEDQCRRISRPRSKVVVVGGRTPDFVPEVNWDEIILPEELKDALMNDVESFFTRGIDVYKRLNLKPFRKLLLAGVPGTGKTMLCVALAKWGLERNYQVIYVSSASFTGATFNKIQQSLNVATHSQVPNIIILEELDAYLHKEEKALVLNVLDGSESIDNPHGTLLLATTNYPETIDERVLKRPGRLDRVFIIPEIGDRETAERMLRHYLGTVWQEEHAALAERLVGYPGAFIREVAVFALTQIAFDGAETLPMALLEDSYSRLRDQIEARDDFLTRGSKSGHKVGFRLAPER